MIRRTIVISIILSLVWSLTAAAVDQNKTVFESYGQTDQPFTHEGLQRIEKFLSDNGSSSFILLRKGKIAYQYGDIHQKHLIHSMRKPILSVLFGKAIKRNQIDLDIPIGQLGLESTAAPLTPLERTATLKHLLTSRSGIYLPALAETKEMRARKPIRGSKTPGEFYAYNNWDFNAAGAAFEKLTGQSIYTAFREQLARPLGMTSYKGKIGSFFDDQLTDYSQTQGLDGYYIKGRSGEHPAYHFRLSSHDLALFGQLLAREGDWQGKQLIAADWIKQSTSCISVLNPKITPNRRLCYGMMWNVTASIPSATIAAKTTAFSHTGLGVHMIYIHPGADIVFVHRVDTENDRSFEASPSALIGLLFRALKG